MKTQNMTPGLGVGKIFFMNRALDWVKNVYELMDTLSLKGLVVAESCTGGLLASWLTQVPGSSRYFWGSVVCYHNEAKTHFLGVKPQLIAQHGAVSFEVCYAMCRGLQSWAGSDCGMAITGIAGPGGGTSQKPVGLVYVGHFVGEDIQVVRLMLMGHRHQIQMQACGHALEGLKNQLIRKLGRF